MSTPGCRKRNLTQCRCPCIEATWLKKKTNRKSSFNHYTRFISDLLFSVRSRKSYNYANSSIDANPQNTHAQFEKKRCLKILHNNYITTMSFVFKCKNKKDTKGKIFSRIHSCFDQMPGPDRRLRPNEALHSVAERRGKLGARGLMVTRRNLEFSECNRPTTPRKTRISRKESIEFFLQRCSFVKVL